MIVMAQQFIEQAQQEAEDKAREMTTGAQERAREIVAEARSRAEDEVNRLNGLKQRLSEDVETLTRQLDDRAQASRQRAGGVLALGREFTAGRWGPQRGGARSRRLVPPSHRPPRRLSPIRASVRCSTSKRPRTTIDRKFIANW